MEITSLLVTLADGHGISPDVAKELSDALLPLADLFSDPAEFSIYFPTVESCKQFGTQHSLATNAVDFLWLVVMVQVDMLL